MIHWSPSPNTLPESSRDALTESYREILKQVALPLQSTCKAVLHNHPEMMKDVGTWSPCFLAFILEGVGDVISRLESQDLDDYMTLPLDSFSLTLANVTKLNFNIGRLSTQVYFLKALKGN